MLQQIRAARSERHQRVQVSGTRDDTDEIMEFDRLALLNKASNKTRPGLLKIAARQRELQRLPKEEHVADKLADNLTVGKLLSLAVTLFCAVRYAGGAWWKSSHRAHGRTR